MSKIQSWFQTNKLCLNEGKTSYMYFNSSPSTPLPPLIIHGLSISPSTEVKFLGLVVDCKLKWKSHIEQLHSKLSTAIFAIRSVRKNVDSCAALLSYHSYFHSLMSYAIVFWGFTNINPILILQKKAVRAVFGLWHWSNGQSVSCRPLFRKHKILTVYAQVILDTCLLIHKLSPSLPRHRNIHQHDTRNRNNIIVSRNMLMDKSFLNQGITLYNKLPSGVREMREEMFKSTLKDALLNLAPYSMDEFQGDLGVLGQVV
uniref:Reverse transcriptase n=1 Tax=Cacopsylla melanoneura TaxID=428564 RepID=A0A8D8WTK6_9HEMI